MRGGQSCLECWGVVRHLRVSVASLRDLVSTVSHMPAVLRGRADTYASLLSWQEAPVWPP